MKRPTVIVLCNQTSAPSRAMVARIASFYLPALAAPDKSIADKNPPMTALLKGVLLDAAQGKANAALFSPSAQEKVAFVQRVGPRFLGPLGPLQSFTLLEQRDEGSRRTYRYRAVFKEKTLVWTFELTQEGKIVNLQPAEE